MQINLHVATRIIDFPHPPQQQIPFRILTLTTKITENLPKLCISAKKAVLL